MGLKHHFFQLLHPEIYQGNNKKSQYFEGWYFKLVSKSGDNIFAIIPGISFDKIHKSSHAFIQFYNGISRSTNYLQYPIEQFWASSFKFEIKIGNNIFNQNIIILNIEDDTEKIIGRFHFDQHLFWPKLGIGQGIMGPFAYVPFLECRHEILSMNFRIEGNLKVNQKYYNLSEGKGYIEKDWGSSFPKAYIWMQSNHFQCTKTSLMISIAKIPSFGLNFTGFLVALIWNEKIFRFTTYSKAKIRKLIISSSKVNIIIEDNRYGINIEAIKGLGTSLASPNQGRMNQRIIESITSKIILELYQHEEGQKTTLYNDIGEHAGLEIMATNASLGI